MNGSTRGVKSHGRTKLRSWEVCGLSASRRERSAKFASGSPGPLRERFPTKSTRHKRSEAGRPELCSENRTRLLDLFRRLVRSAFRLIPAARIPEFPGLHCRLLRKWKRQQDLLQRLVRKGHQSRPAGRDPEVSPPPSPPLEKCTDQQDLRASHVPPPLP